MNTFPQAVILSASQATQHHSINHTNHMELWNFLVGQGYSVKLLKGCYKGDTETSIYVQLKETGDVERFTELATKYNQESILYLDSNRLASLHYCDNTGKVEILGKLVNVPKNVAIKEDSYTIANECTKDEQYFITKPIQ